MVGTDLALQLDAAHFHVIVAKQQGLFQNFDHVKLMFFRFALPRKGKQVLHHSMGPLRLLEDFCRIFFGAGFQGFGFQQLRITQNRGQADYSARGLRRQ